MTSSSEETILANITASQVMVAQMAAQFLPNIELPADWQKIPPRRLSFLVRDTTGRSAEAVACGDITHFEVLAVEAVRRARIVFLAACGYKPPARIARENADHAFVAEMCAETTEREKWEKTFSSQPMPLTGNIALRVILPKPSDSVRQECFRRWREQIFNGRKNKSQSGVSPSLEAALLFEHDSLDQPLDREQFISLAIELHRYYSEHKQALAQAVQRARGKVGGKKSAKLRNAQVATAAAKHGADANGAPVFSKREVRQFNMAAQKVSRMKKNGPVELSVDSRK